VLLEVVIGERLIDILDPRTQHLNPAYSVPISGLPQPIGQNIPGKAREIPVVKDRASADLAKLETTVAQTLKRTIAFLPPEWMPQKVGLRVQGRRNQDLYAVRNHCIVVVDMGYEISIAHRQGMIHRCGTGDIPTVRSGGGIWTALRKIVKPDAPVAKFRESVS
jgi:hypothetical protein